MSFFKTIGKIAGAVGGITSAAGPVLGFLGGERANSAQAAQAANAQAFNERGYRHRYQWQMEDMRKAGLNPILSYKTGAPGGPAGVQAPQQNTMGEIGSSARSALLNRAQLRQAEAQVQNTEANTAKTLAEQKKIEFDTLNPIPWAKQLEQIIGRFGTSALETLGMTGPIEGHLPKIRRKGQRKNPDMPGYQRRAIERDNARKKGVKRKLYNPRGF